ncbi:NAD(P)-dependent oxidoreductase [Halodesulfovibrio aestuarii]|uniref:NAD(P)-dependent oxidoreductase n=1 Tax=Halodesulfovibrio aestuarii TaxID=126333 RepID=A0ABV4JWD8_9BACT
MLTLYNIEPVGYSEELEKLIRKHFRYIPSHDGLTEDMYANAEIIVTRLGTQFSRATLKKFRKLKCICTPTTGLNHIDLSAALDLSIAIVSLKGETEFLREITATAELTWSLILNLVRNVPKAVKSVTQGHWNRDSFIGYELKGKQLGIIGYGRLGSIVHRYADAFGMSVVAYDPNLEEQSVSVTRVALEELLEQSDFISLHASYSSNVGTILPKAKLSLIKHGAYFINTARGELVDEECLIALLTSGQLAGVALDVLSSEYDKLSDAMLSESMLSAIEAGQNLLITPHIGGVTHDSMRNTEKFIIGKLISKFSNVT